MKQTSPTAIIGVDEAGRGPLAGPIVAAAVWLPLERVEDWYAEERSTLPWLTDSKKVTEKRREILCEDIQKRAVAYEVSFVSPTLIDQFNIRQATHMAQTEAVEGCCLNIEHTISIRVDGGEQIPDLPYPQEAIVNGDAREISISAASILAKVSRDRYMIEQERVYPAYGFAKHKGYGTKAHREAIRTHGLSPLHRKTFCQKTSA